VDNDVSWGNALWRKTRFSGSGSGNCVEVAALPGQFGVRDSKDRGGPILTFDPTSWRNFVRSVRTG